MKSHLFSFVIFICTFTLCTKANSQKGQNEFEKRRVTGLLDANNTSTLNAALKQGNDANIIQALQTILGTANTLQPQTTPTSLITTKGSQSDLNTLSSDVNSTITNITNYGSTGSGENAAVIVVYRDMTIGTSSKIDFASLKTLIYHKKRNNTDISNYLLSTKKVFFVFIDLDDVFYATAPENEDKKLEHTAIKIKYKKSFFRQSVDGATSVWQGTMGADKVNNLTAPTIKLTLVEVNRESIKEPCDIIGSHKQIKEDLLTFPIHERNLATVQFGVENTKYQLNNFSITGGNLVVKPNSDQKESWKSSLYSVIELHIPRDIDNFQPFWKDVFSKGRNRKAGQYFYDAIISRIGVYGGVKVSKDPLSNLYSGFNFAITKELAVNFGWTWTNEVVPQVTAIGSITSLSDALEYARRTYSNGKFSWGLSFAPSAVIGLLGLKSNNK